LKHFNPTREARGYVSVHTIVPHDPTAAERTPAGRAAEPPNRTGDLAAAVRERQREAILSADSRPGHRLAGNDTAGPTPSPRSALPEAS
jgi:hypothetical protein